MAITKLLRLKEANGKSKATHLKNNIFYICNPEKCGAGLWIGGNAGSTPQIIFDTMIRNKQLWNKEDGSQGFHYVISFPPELGISQEMAAKVAEDFAEELLGGRFFYCYAVHNDRDHMHAHITFDSVSKEDGYKFHSPKGDWEKRIQPITDRICRKYNLPELEYSEEKKGKSYGQWKSDQTREDPAHEINWYDLIRDDIDLAIREAESYEEVLRILRDKHYEIREGKYLSLRPYGRQRAVRSSRLGNGYSIEDIRERVKMKSLAAKDEGYPVYGNRAEIIAVLKIRISQNPKWKMTPFQRKFYRRWNNSFLRNKPGRPQPWKTNEDVVRVRRLSDAVKYMIDHDIGSAEDLEKKWKELTAAQQSLKASKKAIQTKLQRQSPYREVSRYEKLKKQSEEDPSPEIVREMDLLLSKIEKHESYENALAGCRELRDELQEYQEKLKAVNEEMKVADDLFTFYYEMPTHMPERENSQSAQPGRRHVKNENPVIHHGDRFRITIHKSLISGKSDEAFYVVRIPGTENLVKLPAGDCLMYKSGTMLSAYIYEGDRYSTEDELGDAMGALSGKELKTHFDRKAKRTKGKVR